MSYRTYVNGVQIFGNNECYQPWIDFIKSEGIEVDDEGCYEGDITHIDEALTAIESVVDSMVKHNYKVCDFSKNYEFWNNTGLNVYGACKEIIESSYLFMPYNFIQYCGDNIEEDLDFTQPRPYRFKLAENGKVHVRAS